MTFPLGSLYHGTKFAVEGITEALNYELNSFNVKARLVEPGAIATDFAGRSFDFQNDESLAEYQTLVTNLWAAFEGMLGNASPASLVAVPTTGVKVGCGVLVAFGLLLGSDVDVAPEASLPP